MGLFSRQKGRREEQQLVLALASLGYKAERILRQYQVGLQPDVIATKGDFTCTFEIKSRHNSFKTIYDKYYKERDATGVFAFALGSGGPYVAMSTYFPDLLNNQDRSFRNMAMEGKQDKVLTRIVGLNKLRGQADYLVIRDNNKVRLYLKYWM